MRSGFIRRRTLGAALAAGIAMLVPAAGTTPVGALWHALRPAAVTGWASSGNRHPSRVTRAGQRGPGPSRRAGSWVFAVAISVSLTLVPGDARARRR